MPQQQACNHQRWWYPSMIVILTLSYQLVLTTGVAGMNWLPTHASSYSKLIPLEDLPPHDPCDTFTAPPANYRQEWLDGCDSLGLKCMNGGRFNSDLWMNCKKDFAPNCNQIDWYHNDTIKCTCPKGYTGIDCSIETEELCPPSPPPALFWDNTWLNTEVNNKHAMCQVEDTPDVDYYGLHDNRAMITFHAKNASFEFALMSRIRWKGPDPHDDCCSPVVAALTCTLTRCEMKRIHDNPDVEVQYICPGKQCKGCDSSVGPGCDALSLVFAAVVLSSVPITIEFSHSQPNGTARGRFLGQGLTPINLALGRCATGQCVMNYSTNNGTLPDDRHYDTPIIITISSISTATLIFLCCGIGALIANRKAARGGYGDKRGSHASVNEGGSAGYDGPLANGRGRALSDSDRIALGTQELLRSGQRLSDADDIEDPRVHGSTPCFGLAFEDISFFINADGQSRQVLDSVSGLIKPGELVAIMGPSGSGKTSLLNILGGRDKGGRVTGAVEIYAEPASAVLARRRMEEDAEEDQAERKDGEISHGGSGGADSPISPLSPLRTPQDLLVHGGSPATLATPNGHHPNGALPHAANGGSVNGSVIRPQQAARISYVLQDEQLMPTQTVRETLSFSAALRCPKNTSREISRRVNSVLSQLRLNHIADQFIGSPDTGGISGGERRRVTIGIELVTNPSLVLLDEPTSGLDSHNAALLISVLRDIATSGRACILSIHQSSTAIYAMFDKLFLLAPHGYLTYFGPPVRAQEHLNAALRAAMGSVSVSGKHGQKHAQSAQDAILSHSSPAEFVLDVVSQKTREQLRTMANIFASSALYTKLRADIAETRTIESPVSPRGNGHGNGHGNGNPLNAFEVPFMKSSLAGTVQYAAARPLRSCCVQFAYLMRRQLRNVARTPSLLLTHLIVTTFVAVAMGIIFWQVDNKIPGMQNRVGGLFFLCVFYAMTAMSSLGVFVSERRMYLREYAAGFYSPISYFTAACASDLIPLRIFPPFLFGLIVYYMMGLQALYDKFIIFMVGCVLVNVVATALCLFMSSASSNIGQANFLTVIVLIFSMMFGGLFLNSAGNDLSTFLRSLSFFHYGFETLFVNEFDGLDLLFNPEGFPTTRITGQVIINNYAMDLTQMIPNLWKLLGMFGGLLFIAFIALLLRTRR